MAALQIFLAVALCFFAQVQGQACDVSAEEALGTISVCTVTSSEIADGTADCTLTCFADDSTRTLACDTGALTSTPDTVCPDFCTVPAVTDGDYGTAGDDCDAACAEDDTVAVGAVCCLDCAATEIATPDGGEITCMDTGDFSEASPSCEACATAAFENCDSCSYDDSDNVVCDSCTSGNVLNEAGDACEACTAAATDEHCTACDTNVCTECEDGYELNGSDICVEEESDEDSAVTVKISFLAVLMTSVGAWLFA